MEPPLKPDESDCCNSGCNPCILDVYEEQLRKFELGRLENTSKSSNCLSGTTYTVFKIIDKRRHERDALLVTFEYGGTPMDDVGLSYRPGQYFLLKAGKRNDEFTRAYTPIPFGEKDRLQFTVLVKLYPNGRMSKYIKTLRIGSETLWRGPYGDYSLPNPCKHMLLVAQGAAIAPVYSIIDYYLNDENCNILFKLFYCCKTNNTIYLRDGLYGYLSYWNFEYEVFLSEANGLHVKYNETVHRRKLIEGDIESYLLGKDDVVVTVAGSEEFMGSIKGYAVEFGMKEESVVLL